MASRLKRYKGEASITLSASEITDKKVNIVLLDGRVFLGKVIEISTDKLEYRNTRNSLSQVTLNTISEIIIDYKA